jgi:hypothetical protein
MNMLAKLKEKSVIITQSANPIKANMDVEMEDEEEKTLNDIKQESKGTSKYNDEVKGMFDHANASSNFDSLYKEYSRLMTSDQLDERFLFEE